MPTLRPASFVFVLFLASACGEDPPSSFAPTTVTVDGRTVSYVRSGAGPSVVLESGLGDGAAPWSKVFAQPPEATLFAYDRAGYGGSSPSPDPRDGDHLVEELRRTLQAVRLAPPYLLVGHSLGGQLVLLYARRHPGEVRGVVLVDARPAGFTERCVDTLGDAECILPPATVEQLPATMRAEYEASPQTESELLGAPAFPEVPVVVLSSSDGPESAAWRALWATMQDELATELSATHRTVAGAGHYVQRDAPEQVVQAIREALVSP